MKYLIFLLLLFSLLFVACHKKHAEIWCSINSFIELECVVEANPNSFVNFTVEFDCEGFTKFVEIGHKQENKIDIIWRPLPEFCRIMEIHY